MKKSVALKKELCRSNMKLSIRLIFYVVKIQQIQFAGFCFYNRFDMNLSSKKIRLQLILGNGRSV